MKWMGDEMMVMSSYGTIKIYYEDEDKKRKLEGEVDEHSIYSKVFWQKVFV